MFFQLNTKAASLTVSTRAGNSYLFERGKPLRVNDRDIAELRGRQDLEECPEEGIQGKRTAGPKPKSVIKFDGPAVQPPPKPKLHDPSPTELGTALAGARPKSEQDEEE